jgi:hypothetical protein
VQYKFNNPCAKTTENRNMNLFYESIRKLRHAFRKLLNIQLLMKDYRLIYIIYLIIAILSALSFNAIYNLSDTPQNAASLIANTSELLGLAIALTEIFVLTGVTDRVRKSIDGLRSYSDISSVSIFLSQTIDDLTASKYGKAILRLEKIRDVYQENLSEGELLKITSIHRENYDKLNSMILKLSMVDSSFTTLSKSDLKKNINFLISFNEIIISLKITFKKSIL